MAVTEIRETLADQARVKVELTDSFGRRQQIYINLLEDPVPQQAQLDTLKTIMETEEQTIAANLAALNP